MSNLGLKDTLPFGKHKSKTVEEVYKADASYLVWLRHKRAEDNGDRKFFDEEVSFLLDAEIRGSGNLRKKFKPFNVPMSTDPVTKVGAAEVNQQGEHTREVAYRGTWGAF